MKNSKIEWTDHTFNPWIGCAKVSDGCKNCYAETLMDTRFGSVQWGVEGTRNQTSGDNWKEPHSWSDKALRTGIRRRVFCGSLCDVFEDRHDTNAWRINLMELIELTHGLDWLLLTKRPENVVRLIQQAAGRSVDNFFERNPHVWIGASVENQEQADRRIPHLLEIPAVVRFLSMEPLLGPVDISGITRNTYWMNNDSTWDVDMGIQWVIVGGESGPRARPMHPWWVRSIQRQCYDNNVPFFFKQWGEWGLADYSDIPSVWVDEDTGAIVERTLPRVEPPPFRSAAVMKKIGKRTAGRLLDGREWNEFPEATR